MIIYTGNYNLTVSIMTVFRTELYMQYLLATSSVLFTCNFKMQIRKQLDFLIPFVWIPLLKISPRNNNMEV